MSFFEKLRSLLQKYREQIMYLIFGAGTTIVSWVVFEYAYRWLGVRLVWLSNLLSFIAAVIFAYITNKLFVFRSRSWDPRFLWKEISSFLAARIVSFFFEELGMILCVQVFHFGEYSLLGVDGAMVSKIALSVIVVILNYFFSKFVVFKKRQTGQETPEPDEQ